MNALQAVSSESIGVAFIYCNYSEAEKQSATNLLKSILLQLASRKRETIEELTAAYKKHSKEGTSPCLLECCHLLHAVTALFSKIYLVIDALDECAERTRDMLVAEIGTMKPQINVLCTSRHTFTNCFSTEDASYLEVKANASDIRHYLDKRITESPKLQALIKKDGNIQDIITSGVANKANGMYA